MSIELRTLRGFDAVICFYDGSHLIHDRLNGVIVLVPNYDDRAAALGPCRGGMDRSYDLLDRLVPQQDQRRIETRLCSIAVGIEIAERSTVSATVLIVALVRHDEREGRH